MRTTARLLAVLAMSLPLAACAAQPAPAAPAVQAAPAAPASQPAARAQEAAAAAPAPAVAAAPESRPAQSAQAGGQRAASERKPASQDKAAGTNAPAAAAPTAAAPASAAGTAASSAVSDAPAAANTPAPAPAPAAATALPGNAGPETTVGGGAANRAPAPPATGPVSMPAGSATGSLLQTLFALIVVLAVLGGLAWFLKRYGPKAGIGNANLRIVGSLNLGGRERLLVVEIGDQWIVVGASPGRVNALATMPRQQGIDGAGATLAQGASAGPSANSFADWLKQTIDKRK